MIYNVSGEVSNFRLNPVEIYGFVAWVVTAIFTILYTVYAWTPDSVLNSWGLTYLPNKYYLIAIPNWIGTSYVCANMAHDAVCLIKSHPRQSYFTLQDKFTKLSHPRQQIATEPQSEQKTTEGGRQSFKRKPENSEKKAKTRERISEI